MIEATYPEDPGMPRCAVLWAMFCLGFFALVAQAMSMREILVAFHGNELTIGATLACWLVGVSSGALGARLMMDRLSQADRKEFVLGFLLLAVAVLFPFQIYFLRTIRGFIAVPAGEYASFAAIISASFVLFFPCCSIIGFAFPVACQCFSDRVWARRGSGVGLIYSAEAAGSMVGGIVFTFLLLPYFSPMTVVFFCCGVALSGVCLLYSSRVAKMITGGPAVVLLIAALLYPAWLESLEQWTVRARWQAFGVRAEATAEVQGEPGSVRLVDSMDTLYQNLALTECDGQYALYENGRVGFLFPDPIHDEHYVHFLMAQRPKARRVLMLGGNPVGYIPEILKYRPDNVTYVELDAGVGSLIKRVLPKDYDDVLQDPCVRVQIGDAVEFVRKCGERFDVIIINAPEPATAGNNRFYTLEFYRKIAALLDDDGVMATSVNASLRMQSDAANIGASVYRTLKSVFPTVIVTAEPPNIFLAGQRSGGVTFDRQALFNASRQAAPATQFFRPEYFLAADEIDPEKTEFVRKSLEAAQGPLNTMLQPAAYFFNLLLWGRLSESSVGGVLDAVRRLSLRGIVVVVLCFGLFSLVVALSLHGLREGTRRLRTQQAWAKIMVVSLIGGTGFCAMAMELALIFMFQSLYGYVYARIGLIVAVFMLGLVAGALCGRLFAKFRGMIPFLWLAVFEVVLLACAALIPVMGAGVSGLPFGETLVYLCVLIVGFAVGAEFPLGNRIFGMAGGSPGAAAAVTDASDHLGAALGALIVGVLLVPLLGIGASCVILAAVKCAGLFCLTAAAVSVKSAVAHDGGE